MMKDLMEIEQQAQKGTKNRVGISCFGLPFRSMLLPLAGPRAASRSSATSSTSSTGAATSSGASSCSISAHPALHDLAWPAPS
jgi:hypothetical protein